MHDANLSAIFDQGDIHCMSGRMKAYERQNEGILANSSETAKTNHLAGPAARGALDIATKRHEHTECCAPEVANELAPG